MPRMFEVKDVQSDGEVLAVIDLEKVCLVRLEKEPGHSYPRITVRFVDGHEHHDIIPDKFAHHLIDAYRAYLTEQKDGTTCGT
jgi:hypothetical protein